jgi:hypothetical protein
LPWGKYTIEFTEFLGKHRDGKSLPPVENKRDIPEKTKSIGFLTRYGIKQKKRPEVRGAFK